MQDTAPKTPAPLADGEYRFTVPAQGYRLAQPMSATVTGGQLTAWAFVSPDGTLTPAADAAALKIYGAAMLAQLAHEVSEAQRLAGIVRPALFTPSAAPSIGKPHAANLHRELGRLGFRDHYAAASDALGREVRSLAALSEAEARTVRSYARGAWGLSA